MQIANTKHASASGPDGTVIEFSPGEPVEVPDELAAELIAIKDAGFYDPAGQTVRPGEFVNLDEGRIGRTAPSPFPVPPASEDEQAALDAIEAAREVAVSGPAVPPKVGRGSTTAAWVEYAKSKGYELPDASRDQIIAHLDSHGVPTEQAGGTATVSDDDDPDAVPGETPEPSEPAPPVTEVDPASTQTEVDPADGLSEQDDADEPSPDAA